ncbi:MAG: efflux RND transporter permease subunit [Pseudomonadota bacterium]
MTLPELSIRRHVLALMLSLVLVLFGLVAYERMGVDQFPDIDFPVVSVTTTLPGGNPEVVDSSVTNVIEAQVNSVPGIDRIESSSSPGVSVVTIQFDLSKDVDVAFNEVQSKVNQVLEQLPDDAEPPVVGKVETGASPVMWLSLQGDRTQQQLNRYANTVIKKQLETVNGVGRVRLGGRRDRTIRVNLDLDRMASVDVTVPEVVDAFDREHVQFPGGFLVSERSEGLLKLDMEYHDPQALAEMVVASRDGGNIRLEDFAEVEDGLEDYRELARYRGESTVGLGVVKIAGANTVAITEEVKRRLDEEIVPQLPAGMELTVSSDDSLYIMEMIHALEEHVVLGTLLAAIVVLLFLKSLRSTAIIAVAIPVSLLGAIAVMYFAGYTFNNLTLLALLLLVGVVVDDAIVVLENIYRHREKLDPHPIRAAINGTNQVVFAVLAATLTLVAIFAPVIFMGGIIGRFFESFAVVVTFGVLVSWFVSMTLTPMLCSRFLSVEPRHNRLWHLFENAFQAMERAYRGLLGAALGHRWKVIALVAAMVGGSTWFFADVGKTFTPEEDQGAFMVILRAPLGSNIDYTDEKLREVEAILEERDDVYGYFAAIGLGDQGQVNEGLAFVRLVDRAERERSQQAIIAEVNRELREIPGVRAFARKQPMIGGQRGDPLQFAVRGNDLDEVGRLSRKLQERLEEIDGMGRLDRELELDLPQVDVDLDRGRAAQLGISAADVAMAVNTLAGGLDVGRYNDVPSDGERYDVRLKAADGELATPADLRRIYVRSGAGEPVRLDTVADFREVLGPAVITRVDLQYGAKFYGDPELPLAEAAQRVEEVGEEMLPAGYSVTLMGEAEEFEKTAGYMGFAFLMAIILLYMVLSSQFNSFLQPFIIMVAQPLAMIGGVIALWMTGNTLNIFSMIGLLLLLGLVAKNSILLVDLTNQTRAEGKGIDEALREACPIRLRPVLMTSLTVILALLPAALGLGAGADTNGPLAIAVIGGMITATLLTLVVVPAVYSLLENGLLRWRSHHRTSA